MSRLVAQRARLSRVRRIQHNLAATAAARASQEVAKLEMSAAQIARIRTELGAGEGIRSGAVLASLGELAMRLDHAREGLGKTIGSAKAAAAMREAQRLTARREQESAEKLEERAVTAAEAMRERRLRVRGRIRPRLAEEEI